jgi:cytochrome c-type biogenesis protein CcmH
MERKLVTTVLLACLLVAGIGTGASYLKRSVEGTASRSLSGAGSEGEMLARLQDYARSIGSGQPVPAAAPADLLPDVNTMIERLVARLDATPEDINGWRILGWSYFHTGRYKQAATAYAKAVQLDPNSAELKLSYEGAAAKAFERDGAESASSLHGAASGDGLGEGIINSDVMTSRERDAAIRSMVDGLAHRLESSPRDVAGWARLMRSRVVLGERAAAETAFRKALQIFRDDEAASGKIAAAASELGLKSE